MTRRLGATYRVQLRPEFDFRAAAAIAGYLVDLGVECLYCSPVLEAVPGSTHGYDGTDPSALRAELGGEEGFLALAGALEDAGLGLVLDIVPNHLATDPRGRWWRDVLARGRESDFAEVFDIDWEAHPAPGRVTLPLLDRPLPEALAAGLVRLAEADAEPVLRLGARDLPVAGGRPRRDEDVGEVLAQQHYRLVDWHDAGDRNYRRFFDIDDLVGVRVERAEVFDRVHERVVDLCRRGLVTALRVDHLDGLADPPAYLRRLREATAGIPVLVEKILAGDETLDARLEVIGTTGYEAIDDIDGALVDPVGLAALTAAARREGDDSVGATVAASRAEVLHGRFPAELARLAARLGAPEDELARLVVDLPRYRTYGGEPEEVLARAGADRALLARLRAPQSATALALLEQLCAAVAAKGVEDTAWYRLLGPLVFCEVGGDPGADRHDGVARLHRRCADRVAHGRPGLVPGSTHDAKRSADARARLLALSERAAGFEEGLTRLAEVLGGVRRLRRELRLVAELVLATLPPGATADDAYLARLTTVLVKCAREEKRRTSWTAPDLAFESRLTGLLAEVLANDAAALRASLAEVLADVVRLGALYGLSMVALRSSLPGVPDCYQGEEVWNLALVDPDNRCLVDHRALAGLLLRLPAPAPEHLSLLRAAWRDGRAKLYLTRGALSLRRDLAPVCGACARHAPVPVEGDAADSLLGISRADGALVAIVTRRGAALLAPGDDLPHGGDFGSTRVTLPSPGAYREVLTGVVHETPTGRLEAAAVLAAFPVALLSRA